MIRRLLTTMLLFTAPCSDSGGVQVFAAASLTNVLQEAAAAYEKDGGERIVFNFAGSNTLGRQIESGAPADLFLSADEATMDRLAAHDLIVAGSRKSVLSNSLVVVVPATADTRLTSAAELQRLESIAIAQPESVPAGVYAREWLTRTGVWNDIASRVIPTDNVRSALAAVEEGNAEAAIVYATDARISHRTRIAFEVPHSESPLISYPFAIVAAAPHPEAARRFLGWLESPAARAIFTRHGFLVPRGSA